MRTKRIDYSKKNLSNPFFRRSKKKRRELKRKNLKIVLLTLLSLILIGSLFWFFIFCNFWVVKKIEISGLSRISSKDVESIVKKETDKKKWWVVPGDNILFINEDNIEEKIKNKYHFSEISIKKNIPDKINIKIKENTCNYILKEAGKTYYVDENNYIMKEVRSDLDESKYPQIKNKYKSKIKGGKVDLNKDYIKYINEIKRLIKSQIDDIQIKNFFLDADCERDVDHSLVKLQVLNGPRIHLNSNTSAQKQIDKLILVKNKLEKEFWNKEYITLEYGDKIFYQ